MLFSLLILNVFSSDGCVCDKTQNVCDIYCSCDPDCNESIKQFFPFDLPSTEKPSFKISCDPSKQIRTDNDPNTSFIITNNNQELICYTAPIELSNSDEYKTFGSDEYGISSFNGTNISFSSHYFNQDKYTDGQPILIRRSTLRYYAFPIGIGSDYCNSFQYLSYKKNLPHSTCLLPLEDWSSYDNLISPLYLFPKPSSNMSDFRSFPTILMRKPNNETTGTPANDMKYVIGITGSDGQITSASSILFDSHSPFDTIVVNQGTSIEDLSISSDVKWYDSVKSTSYLKELATVGSTGPSGYIIGYPVQVDHINNVLEIIDGVVCNFGEDMIMKRKTPNKWLDSYSSVLISSGQTIQDADITALHIEYPNNYTSMRDVTWTFYFKKIGRNAMPVHIIVGVNISAENPRETENDEEWLTFRSKFIEINNEGNGFYQEQQSEHYRAKFGDIFTFFFDSDFDIIRTSSIFSVIVIIVTIWIFVGFGFDYSH